MSREGEFPEDTEAQEVRLDRRANDVRAEAIEAKSVVNRRLIDALAITVIALLLIVGVVSAIAVITAIRVGSIEHKDRNTSRATAFRLCTRNKVDRAFAHASIRGIPVKGQPTPPPLSPAEKRLRVRISETLMAGSFLPILNCDPNLVGLGAAPLPIKAQELYLRRWAAGDLRPAERGICPHQAIGDRIDPHHC